MIWNILSLIGVFFAGVYWKQVIHFLYKTLQFAFSFPGSLYPHFQSYRNYSDRRSIWRAIRRHDQVIRYKQIIKYRIENNEKNRERYLKFARGYPFRLRIKGEFKTAQDDIARYIKEVNSAR